MCVLIKTIRITGGFFIKQDLAKTLRPPQEHNRISGETENPPIETGKNRALPTGSSCLNCKDKHRSFHFTQDYIIHN